MISVVIPAYNCEKTIEGCIKSVLQQTRVDLITEIIVVNDGSVDGTVDAIQRAFENNSLIKIISQQNGGVASARNKGIINAQGEWIALIDADDCWLPEKIEKQWRKISHHREIVFIGGNRNEEIIQYGEKVEDDLYRLSLKQLLIKMWPHTSTALIKKEVFQNVGMYNQTMRYYEDGELWCRIALKYDLYYITDSCEIAGGNKRSFGESGLSANLKEMQKGCIKNIKLLRSSSAITNLEYLSLFLLYQAKYIRRIAITKLNKTSVTK